MKLLKSKKPKEIELQLYESLDDIMLHNWSKMQEKNDPNWLRIDFDGRQPKIKDIRLDELKKRLEDEYFVLWDDDKFKENLKKRNEIAYYIGLYDTVQAILYRMNTGIIAGIGDKEIEKALSMEARHKYIEQLKKLRYVMPLFNSVQGDLEEIKRLYQQNEGIKTKIKLLSDSIETESVKVTRRLNTELGDVANILGYGYAINAKEITVADWIDLQKQAIEINSKRKLKE